MLAFLTNVEIDVIIGVVCFLVGLSPLGTKVTDFFKGIPSDLRSALNGVEATVVSNVKAAQTQVVASLPIPAAKQPVVQAAPAAPHA
jgi:hypothetical protein